MSDADKTLKLRIEVDGYIMPGAVEAEAKLKSEADQLARSMGVITVSAAEAEKALAEMGEKAGHAGSKIHESSEHVRSHAGHAREMHHVFGELNRIVPGLGTALKGAFHPDSIGIVGCILAFEALKSVLEDIKALDEIKLANFTGDQAAIEAVRESYEKARVAAAAFVDEQNHLNRVGLTADEVAKRQIENQKNLASAQEQFNSAAKKFADSEVDERERKGVITHAEALKEKFVLDVEYARRKLQLEAQTEQAELAAKQKELATVKTQLAQAQGDLATDESNAAASAAAKEKHEKRKETAKQNIEDAQKTLEELGKDHASGLSPVKGMVNEETAEELQEYYEKYVGDSAGKNHTEMFAAVRDKMTTLSSKASWDLGLTDFVDRTIGKGGDAAWAKYDDAKNQVANGKKELRALEESQFKIDLNAERGKKQLDATEEAVRKLSASVEELTRTLPQMQADAAAKINNAAAVQNLDLRSSAIKAGLPDPGNIFPATARPVGSSAPAPTVNPTPWRYNFSPHATSTAPSATTQAQGDFAAAEHAQIVLQSGGKLAANEMEHIRHLAEVMSGHAVSSNQVLATLKSMMATQQAREAAFQRELAALSAQHNSARNIMAGG